MNYNTYIYGDNRMVKYGAITIANKQTCLYEIENACGWQCRQAVRTSSCGGIPADLTFCFFLVKQKEEKNTIFASSK
jgi:hypothetical protein